MENKLTKRILTGVVGLIFIIGIIITFSVISNGSLPGEGTPERTEFENRAWNSAVSADKSLTNSDKSEIVSKAVAAKEESVNSSASSIVTFATYLTFITLIVLVIFGIIIPTLRNPKSMVKSFWMFAGALGIFLAVIWFTSAGKVMPEDMETNLVKTYERYADSKETELMGLKGKAGKADSKKYKVDLFKEYLESKDTPADQVTSMTQKYVADQRAANVASVPAQKQSDHNMAGWAITTTMILTMLTLLAWVGGAVYSLIKK